MSKAEKFIQNYTRNCSNELDYVGTTCKMYHEWLTPDQARKAVEIAREEVLNEACKWLDKNADEYTWCHEDGRSGIGYNMIGDFRKALEEGGNND